MTRKIRDLIAFGFSVQLKGHGIHMFLGFIDFIGLSLRPVSGDIAFSAIRCFVDRVVSRLIFVFGANLYPYL